jgi:hypothetical protein
MGEIYYIRARNRSLVTEFILDLTCAEFMLMKISAGAMARATP